MGKNLTTFSIAALLFQLPLKELIDVQLPINKATE